jgi:hypothetical protein
VNALISSSPSTEAAMKLNISSSSSFNISNPAPRSIPGLSNSVEMTKKQRDNAKKASRVAAGKQEAELAQNERLKAHRALLGKAR